MQYEKNLLFQNHLAHMLDIWYSGALLSLLKWWPQVPKSSAALGFGFELLNSGERFRAIKALLFSETTASMNLKFHMQHDQTAGL